MEFTIEARGLRFRAVQWGTRKDPILLLHGLFGPLDSFDLLVDAVGGARSLLAYDQRGHGGSTYPGEGYDIPTLAADAAAIIHELGEPVDVVGYSMGAAVALTLAARHHGVVRRLIMCEPPIDETSEGEIPRLVRDAPTTFPSSAAGVAYQMAIQSDLTEERAMLRLKRVRGGVWTWNASIEGLQRLLSGEHAGALAGFRPWLDAPLINCPTIVVRGSESAVFTQESFNRMVATIPPAEGIEIAEARHGVPHYKPHVLAGLMRGFLPARG